MHTIMTFSDAEEDQPSVMQNGTASPNSSSNSEDARPLNSTQTTSPEGATAEGSSSSNSLVKEASQSSTSPSVSTPTPCSATSSSINHPSGSSSAILQNGISDSPLSDEPEPLQAINSSPVAAPVSSSDQTSDDSVALAENSPKDLETKKVLEKLQQIHGYIQQTATAMQNLENEGDLGLQDCLLEQFEAIYNHLQCQESECIGTLSQSLSVNVESGSSGSASMGVIGTLNDEGNRASMSERLAFHESEQQQLSERLRESLVRREELMTRYQATRERLNNLKQQRMQYVQEERRLLQSVGVSENPYDDPIPGAETWSIEQLETGIRDFQGLRDKVDNLHSAYTAKLQGLDENDAEGRNEMQRKIEQIMCKRTQIGSALTQMSDLIQAKRENGRAEEALANDTSPSSAAAPNSNPPAPSEASGADIRRPTEESTGLEVEIEPANEAGRASMANDLIAKQQHLQSLKDQLVNMKRLLQVTEEAAAASGSILNDPEFNAENETTENDESRGISSELTVDGESGEPILESTVVGVRGKLIHLSEIERRNPEVISKYKQLSEAKERLAKMEEVMNKITEARQSGRPLAEVLTAENLDLLEKAKEDDLGTTLNEDPLANTSEVNMGNYESDESRNTMLPAAVNDDSAQAERLQIISPVPVITQPRRNVVNRVEETPSNGRSSEWEREREISAMQFHLKKSTPQIPLVNEGFQVGREKGAIKKQARNLVNESGADPRLQEVRVLQEELKEKKNALEALMRRMGKSSSFTLDNISDNISENISDTNSDAVERPLRRYFSNHHSEDERREAPPEEFSLGYSAPRHQSVNQRAQSDKNRNRCNPQKSQRNQDSNHFSVNDLSSVPESVRPKHNRAAAGNIPATSWEGLTNPSVPYNQSHVNSNSKVENTVASALSQLSQVQETINSLYGELRTAEISASRPHELPVPNIYGTNTMVPQPNVPYNAMAQNLMPNYCMSPLPNNAQGRGDLGPSNYVLAGLQQCFSQLYLHSLEIQSLSKHLQIIDQREKSISPPQQRADGDQRVNSVERRSERQRANDNLQPNSNQSEYVNFFRLLSNAGGDDRKGKAFPRVSESGGRNGVSNPLYSRLPNSQHRPRGQQVDTSDELIDLEFASKNLLPFDGSASDDVQHNNGELLLDSSSYIPMEGEELNEGLSWTTVSSPPMPHQSTDVLNNQVLPGTRANNYWDNFRSYSRQNPLSTVAKSNTGEHISLSGSSTPGRGHQTLNTSGILPQPAVFENKNRQFNKTSYSNNSINKASDKNSSSSRSQNKGGARARYSQQQINGRRPVAATNSLHHFNTGSSSVGPLDGDAGKRNNRHDLRSAFPEVSFPEAPTAIQNQGIANNEEMFFSENVGVNSNSYRRLARGSQERVPRKSEDIRGDLASSAARRHNPSSAEDVSETFGRVMREAESLMEKHLQQPQFLIQLFHHAAKITSDTDQQVALELLRELSYQRHPNNNQNNSWTSNSSGIHSDNVNASAPTRDARERIFRNNMRYSNKNSKAGRGISGSDASESGITSDEEDQKEFYLLSPRTCSDHSNNQSSVGASPIHVSNSVAHNRQSRGDPRNAFPRDVMNVVAPAANADGGKLDSSRLQRRREERVSPFRNYIANHSPSANSLTTPTAKSNSTPAPTLFDRQRDSPLGDKYNNRRQMRKSIKRNLTKSAEDKSNFSPKTPHKMFDPKLSSSAASDAAQEAVSGFEAVVSASLREVLLCYENADYSLSSTSRILQNLHHAIMRQVQIHSSGLGFSSSFVSSIDSQLKATLRGFYGKSFSSVRQELAAAVTQVLIQEYCSLYTQQENIPVDAKAGHFQNPVILGDSRPSNRTEQETTKRTLTPQFSKQPREHSLFSPHDPSTKQSGRPSNASWPFNIAMEAESVQGNRDFVKKSIGHTREEEIRCDSSNSSKGKGGAISKHSGATNYPTGLGHPDETHPGVQEAANSHSRESPLPEASSFPESWVIHRAASNASDVEGVYSFPESSFLRMKDERELLDVFDGAKVERNDTEADQDQDGARSADFLNLSLPVHDLAEADQSQDPIEADCVDSSIENDLYEGTAPVYSQSLTEPKELTLRFHARRIEIPEQGLDEVPTRLLSAVEGGSTPFLLNGRVAAEELGGAKTPPHRYSPFSGQASPGQGLIAAQNGELAASSTTGTDSQTVKEG